MASNQQFCLRWNNHQSTLISVFDHLLESGTLVDCTLAAEGQFLKAHKVVLSACSPYLEALLSQHYEKHPILILKDVSFHELKSMLDYMYRGEVNISQEQLGTFLKAAESLQIKGLTDCGAMSENRDMERSRDIEHGLLPSDFARNDRSLTSTLPKRNDIRKQIPILPRPRSPLVGLPANFMINADCRKVNRHSLQKDGNLGTSNAVRNREGSLSPTIKRKRPSSYVSQNDDPKVPTSLENNVEQNHQLKSDKFQNSSSHSQTLSNSTSVSSSIGVSDAKKPSESENSVDSEVIKREVKMENVEFTDEVQNEDSVEDLTVDEEEEEMDEMDLSQPGPSTASNSLVAAVPWHNAGEGNSEDGLLASQHDSQDENNPRPWSGFSKTRGDCIAEGEIKKEVKENVEKPKHPKSKRNYGAFSCQNCGRSYIRKDSLQRHTLWECGVEPRFQCPFCPQKCKRKSHYVRHLQRQHQDTVLSPEIKLEGSDIEGIFGK
ncbi:longitudinals lacking protein, isoforms A/B/D/L-like isoform X2 [Macrosteles quadrilineatus]|uniref:longitudinals lacking protein, isoforms A/B/D/L-like isoform X2 n=1 Tax=Macrosteles quadrilineatus TaxID=74068 RepID=UPI0023E15E81|nr:longitudinals lacking protein, isoforms A/B/D/L-like isoform X2 [Macrosteles quadrilineatus]